MYKKVPLPEPEKIHPPQVKKVPTQLFSPPTNIKWLLSLRSASLNFHFSSTFDHVNTMPGLRVQATSKIKGLELGVPYMVN